MTEPIICRIDGCDHPRKTRGLCNKHYLRWWAKGTTDDPPPYVRATCSIEGCEDHVSGRGYCNKHYQRLKHRGSVEDIARPTVTERLWSRVDRSGGPDACWPWQGAQNYGYGAIGDGERVVHAHRLALLLTVGAAPDGKPYACHHCDNPPCCNPTHLYWGDADNARDMLERNRRTEKLTPEQVAEVKRRRALGIKRTVVAAQFDITITTVSNITTGRTWGRLTEGEQHARQVG